MMTCLHYGIHLHVDSPQRKRRWGLKCFVELPGISAQEAAPVKMVLPDSHQQSMYDGPDSHFAQGDTEFTAMLRSCFPRMWSKSPVRSHTWSLPPRRLTEGLNGRQDLSQHRSPTMYREDRMRSSSQTSFTEETVAPQRCDPPSYTACHLNDMKDVDGVQEYGNPRFLSSRRSPLDQVFTRTNRPRVEISDHHERADGVGYIDGPIHTGSFPEHHSGERSKYGESVTTRFLKS
ncbi:hypothetical protein KY290_020647 [Solanum tuberosum]|uniref:Uncharacterized protein n=1 Tax=Solanum tuberosum TaxID=4113 RepID=A0ABQ7UZ94_SOLTU|nr:hypothetical protein KY290_020647 [Solanum tuberosum]